MCFLLKRSSLIFEWGGTNIVTSSSLIWKRLMTTWIGASYINFFRNLASQTLGFGLWSLVLKIATSLFFQWRSQWFFPSLHGVRQVNPNSPAIFILGAEFLSRGLNHIYHANPDIIFGRGKRLPVSHLPYVDDFLIFVKQNIHVRLKGFLNLYEMVSGQKVNVVGDKILEAHIGRVISIIGFSRGHFMITDECVESLIYIIVFLN